MLLSSRRRVGPVVAAVLLLVGGVAGCAGSGGDAPAPSPSGSVIAPAPDTPGPDTPAPDSSTGASPADGTAPDPLADPAPGTPCEEGSHPDCSDATGTEGDAFRIIAGYADCLALHGADEADGLCTDLDGDDRAGYADAG
jgi:hypothetical protein